MNLSLKDIVFNLFPGKTDVEIKRFIEENWRISIPNSSVSISLTEDLEKMAVDCSAWNHRRHGHLGSFEECCRWAYQHLSNDNCSPVMMPEAHLDLMLGFTFNKNEMLVDFDDGKLLYLKKYIWKSNPLTYRWKPLDVFLNWEHVPYLLFCRANRVANEINPNPINKGWFVDRRDGELIWVRGSKGEV